MHTIQLCCLPGRLREQARSHSLIAGCQVDRCRLAGRHRRQASSHSWIVGRKVDRLRVSGRHGSKLPRHDAGLDRRDGRQHADANGQYQKAEQENCHLGHKASEGKGTTGVSGWGYCPPQAVFNTGADRKEKTVSDHRAAPGPWLLKRTVFIKISAMAAASLERHLRQALHLPLR